MNRKGFRCLEQLADCPEELQEGGDSLTAPMGNMLISDYLSIDIFANSGLFCESGGQVHALRLHLCLDGRIHLGYAVGPG